MTWEKEYYKPECICNFFSRCIFMILFLCSCRFKFCVHEVVANLALAAWRSFVQPEGQRMRRKPFCRAGHASALHVRPRPRLLHVGASAGRGGSQAQLLGPLVSTRAPQPGLPVGGRPASRTRPLFPELPVSFSRFPLEDFHLGHVWFACVASAAIQRLEELQNETLQLS